MVDNIDYLIHLGFADFRRDRFNHHAQHRLCPAFTKQYAAIFTQCFRYRFSGRLYPSVVQRFILIPNLYISEHLRIADEVLCQYG